MAQRETDVLNKIRLALPRRCKIFRNNSGVLRDKHGKYVRFGVGSPGGSDLLGWTHVEITASMVGKSIAIMTAIEVKSKTGRATKDQLHFISKLREAGGIAFVCRSAVDVSKLLIEQIEVLRK